MESDTITELAPMTPASFIAHYKIVSKLGEGGMGAIYRATDTKLNRDVAIKILPVTFAADADRMARFSREAQVLASLNHVNVTAIYGVEANAIVMELVDGQELPCPVPVDTAIAYARQIAAGLEAAHEKGIVHRDLKPANIKITGDGTVKLLDFGLAKATGNTSAAVTAGAQSPTMSPTASLEMTQAGMLLGTAAYMSPEQAKGQAVDRRADIWAFGVILFEMLTGTQLHQGATVTETLASVVMKEPDYSLLPATTPPRVRRLIRLCLSKDPKLRLRDIGDARLALDDTEADAVTAKHPSAAKRAWLPWLVAGMAVLVAAASTTLALRRPTPPEPVTVRFPIALPEGLAESASSSAPQFVPSPDGRLVAFVARDKNKTALWIRPMGSPDAHSLEKTEGATIPFWSPDSQFIAFFTDDSKLKRIPVAGGSPQTICDVPAVQGQRVAGDGGTWNTAGIIVFGAAGNPLMRVLAAGGPAAPATTLDTAGGETRHSWPQFLPDGRHILYFAQNGTPEKSAIYVQELGSAQRTLVMRSPFRAAWAPPGYLLFPREETLFAQHMDSKTFQLSGEPVSVAEDVTTNEANGRSAFALSGNGLLVYRASKSHGERQLTWYDRKGNRLGVVGKPGKYNWVALSPDDKSAVLAVGSIGKYDAWIMNLTTGALSPVTSDRRPLKDVGVWSPDSQRFALNLADGKGFLELTPASGTIRDLQSEGMATDWTPDGRSILFSDFQSNKLALLPLDGESRPQTINITPYAKPFAHISPNGKFVVYNSAESPQNQIVVASFPSFAEKRQVSIDGGVWPTWRNDGGEITFKGPGGSMMSVAVKTAGKIEAGVPQALFNLSSPAVLFAVSGDAKRFLVLEPETHGAPEAHIIAVVNWPADLKGQ